MKQNRVVKLGNGLSRLTLSSGLVLRESTVLEVENSKEIARYVRTGDLVETTMPKPKPAPKPSTKPSKPKSKKKESNQ